jgi:hypothetical protein
MKYAIALAMLAAIGCATTETNTTDTQTATVGNYSPTHITSGQNENVMWKCANSAVSENSVWIDCGFANGSKTTQSVCVDVYYNRSHTSVVADKRVCSGVILPGETNTSHTVIIDEKRARLSALCGIDLRDCELRSVEFIEQTSEPVVKIHHRK